MTNKSDSYTGIALHGLGNPLGMEVRPRGAFRLAVRCVRMGSAGDHEGPPRRASQRVGNSQEKSGSGMPLMQLASGFCAGFCQKAAVMVSGQPLGATTP